MFTVELTYRTRIGALNAQLQTSDTVATRAEAEELRSALRQLPGLEDAKISIVNAKPLPTVDEAFDKFKKGLAEYRPIGGEQ